jgi:enterochelin esterase-like enzyme
MQMNQAKPSIGTLQRLEHFASKFVDARHVDVWLPEDFDGSKHYGVLYMHDGQMLFDASQTWNAQAWNIDVAISSLSREGRIPETLVVGIWNNGEQRHSEYFPQKFLPTLSPKFRDEFVTGYLRGKPQSDDYLRFLVEELKPHIDQHFPTRPEREHTFVMGSSMGGLISVYAMSEYPHIFGGAAGLSIAWIGMGKPNFELPLAAFNYLQGSLAPRQGHRLYMDHGTTEMDAMYAPYQTFVDEIVRDRGYDQGNNSGNWQSRVFEGTGHNERAWAERLHIPLEFLLGPGKLER